jgi:Co/Zn/Cd efflux system component
VTVRAIALCTYLSAILLVGLVLNSLFNWSWADPIAALVIAAIAVRESVWHPCPSVAKPYLRQTKVLSLGSIS